MSKLRRLALAVLLLAVTQGCAELKDLRKRNRELEDFNKLQAVKIRALDDRLKDLDRLKKDAERWRDMYDKEKKIGQEYKALADKQKAEQERLQQALKKLAKATGAGLRATKEGTALVLTQDILFAKGKNELSPNGKKALAKIAAFLKKEKKPMRIDGHTDADPIRYSGWENNHHLACGRALAVFAELRAQGVPESQLYIMGFGPNRPIADNKTESGKQRNRRVELLLLKRPPMEGKVGAIKIPEPPEPATAPTPKVEAAPAPKAPPAPKAAPAPKPDLPKADKPAAEGDKPKPKTE